jgi:hypothetical protein
MEVNRNRVKRKYIPEAPHRKYKSIFHKKDSYKIDITLLFITTSSEG